MKMDLTAVSEGLKNAGEVLISMSESIIHDGDFDKLNSIFVSLNITAGEEQNWHFDVDKCYDVSEEV